MKTVFDFLSYKSYLNDYLLNQPKKGHGLKTLWAEKVGCNLAYLSRVLNKDAQLSLEQSAELSEILGHDNQERHFFLLLVNSARAGSHKLKAILEVEINDILSQRALLRNRVEIKNKITPSDQMKYYSSWLYSAVHMALTLEGIETKQTVSEYFGISTQRVSEILEFLVQVGLISIEGDKIEVLENKMFLGGDSDLISKHHSNWRAKALQELSEMKSNSIHYSTIYTFSKRDYSRIKEILLKSVEALRVVVRDTAKEEDMACLNIDFFRI